MSCWCWLSSWRAWAGLGEDANGFGAAHLNRIRVALVGEDVGDPVDGGFEPDGITGGGAGNDEFEAMFGVAAEPDEPLARSSGGLLFSTDWVGLVDGCL